MQISSHTQSTISNSAVMDLSFEIVKYEACSSSYSKSCSGSRSDCCTRVCTNSCMQNEMENSSFEAWEQYLEINAGVLQY